MVIQKAFGDVYVGFRKETRSVQKLFERTQEKNNVYLEMAVRKMGRAVEALVSAYCADGMPGKSPAAGADKNNAARKKAMEAVSGAWGVLYAMLTDIYSMAEDMVAQIDRFGADPLEYKDLEKSVARIYTQKKRWTERDEAKRGELIVILTRWMTDEAFMRNWMATYLAKHDLRRANAWMDEYRSTRLALVDKFHTKKLAAAQPDPRAHHRTPAQPGYGAHLVA